MSKLFEPIKIGRLEIKNRLAMSAMDLGFTSDGSINKRFIDFYVERARGGVGLIVVGGCYPEMTGKVWKSIIGLDKDQFMGRYLVHLLLEYFVMDWHLRA